MRGLQLLLCNVVLCICSAELPDDQLAALVQLSPSTFHGDHKSYLGYLAKFSRRPSSAGVEGVAWPAQEDSADGCSQPYTAMPIGAIAVARRGHCSFAEKALRAQAAGAAGIIIVSDSERLIIMGGGGRGNSSAEAAKVSIAVATVQKSVGDRILAESTADPSSNPRVSIQPYSMSLWNPSEGVLLVLATSLVAAGAFFATSDLRSGSPLAPRRDEVVEMDCTMALVLFTMGSVMLVVLFFFMNYLIYVIVFAFCIGGASCIAQLVSSALHYKCPGTRRHLILSSGLGGATVGDVLAIVPAALLVVTWFITRKTEIGWIFQDIIGGAFLCMFQRTLRLPDIKIAAVLLTLMFFFDIFWVFLSPFIFQRSVMIEVAKGGTTGEPVPLLLRIPAIGDPLANDRMLGFGDIALPGLLVSYLLRFDLMSQKSKRQGYFLPGLCGYFCGLCATMLALVWTGSGQPALLYLVPSTLGTTLILARSRRELPALWQGVSTSRDATEVSLQGPEESNATTLAHP